MKERLLVLGVFHDIADPSFDRVMLYLTSLNLKETKVAIEGMVGASLEDILNPEQITDKKIRYENLQDGTFQFWNKVATYAKHQGAQVIMVDDADLAREQTGTGYAHPFNQPRWRELTFKRSIAMYSKSLIERCNLLITGTTHAYELAQVYRDAQIRFTAKPDIEERKKIKQYIIAHR